MTGPNVAPTAPMVAGKLRFGVHACSGEDPDYPARELLYHSAHTRGWQTPRFCRYPQEVVLRLDRPARVQQIQILSHEYKITQRLEIFVGVPPPGETDPERCSFRRLGHLSFHTNERTNYQARELKTVHINDPAVLIKFVVNGPHVNQHNVYNQARWLCLLAAAALPPLRVGVECSPLPHARRSASSPSTSSASPCPRLPPERRRGCRVSGPSTRRRATLRWR